MIDQTHALARRSWVESANGHADFPIQNLPFGIFSPADGRKRGGVAIGDDILDLGAAVALGLLKGDAAEAAKIASGPALNDFFALGSKARIALRTALSALLDVESADRAKAAEVRSQLLHTASACRLHLPAIIGDYTDFYAGIHHAFNVGSLFRPDNPLMPNYKYIPVGYHGRSSSVVLSGTDIRRPNGQRKLPTEPEPVFGPARNLDIEIELGIWIGHGNELGSPIPISEAGENIAGYCLLNDWSARDVQAWEYQPLGPFLAKNFATTISPWVLTPEALAPFRSAQAPRPAGDPAPLPHLFDAKDQESGALDVVLEAFLLTPGLREAGLKPHLISNGNSLNLYWTPGQILTHHASGGCNLRPGDLLGTGTISAPTEDGYGSFLEITRGGKQPITLESGETRTFLQNGDEVLYYARCVRDGFTPIGFGVCTGTILPAP